MFFQRFIRTIMTTSEAVIAKKVPIPPKGVDYRGKVVLAPMVRSGELPSRLLALHYGADLVWGPETVDRAMIGTTRRINPRTGCIEWSRVTSNNAKKNVDEESVVYRLDPVREAGRLVFQIGTSDPERAVAAARLVAGDVAGIDVNAGCPKPFSTTGGMGAALLRTPDKLASILEALVQNIVPEYQIGISVKIRLLETPAETEALVRRLVATGITGLTIHCRTTPMRPRERAIRGQLKMIVDVCHEAGVACLMNGDVESRDHAQKLVEEHVTDGAMIATCAESNPSCFRTGPLADWKETVERYITYAMEVENKLGNTKFMLNQMIPGKVPVFKEMMTCKTFTQTCRALGFEHLMERAKETDEILGLAVKEVNQPKQRQPKGEQKSNKADKKRKRDNDEAHAANKRLVPKVAETREDAVLAENKITQDFSAEQPSQSAPAPAAAVAV
ncbi:dihydrouridine synthase [Diplogelasinospora grovesii]|uniref:Dihydrouridine synthase n=1 Tax=Diplogelasinospora grovesii TaxID=303347 RepID=A0AAN6N753_9PEZI|nr:dihydrouridine synthase [Diplogelasinospora grovesii]